MQGAAKLNATNAMVPEKPEIINADIAVAPAYGSVRPAAEQDRFTVIIMIKEDLWKSHQKKLQE